MAACGFQSIVADHGNVFHTARPCNQCCQHRVRQIESPARHDNPCQPMNHTLCCVVAMTSRLAGHGRPDEDGDEASPDGGSGGGWTNKRRADGVISPMARLRQAQHRC